MGKTDIAFIQEPCYNKETRKAKSSWRDYCCRIEEVHDRAILVRIMASQLANRMGSINT